MARTELALDVDGVDASITFCTFATQDEVWATAACDCGPQ